MSVNPETQNPRGGPQGTTSAADSDRIKLFDPIEGAPSLAAPGSGGDYGNDRGDHIHAGNDISCAVDTRCIAPCDGTIINVWDSGFGLDGGMIHFKFDQGVGPIPTGAVIGWGHAVKATVRAGDKVEGGQTVGYSNYASAPHVHFIYQNSSTGAMDGSADPRQAYTYLVSNGSGAPNNGEIPPDDQPGGGGAGSFSTEDIFAIGRAAAISTELELPGLLNYEASMLLKGDKSIYNDEPLLPFIQQLAQASLRHFQSLPNGTFFAFYPDYFGAYNHRTPYWQIDDIEIVDGGINLNDEALATHVFVVGDTIPDGQITIPEMVMSKGVVTIFDAFASSFMFESPDVEKNSQSKSRQLINRARATEFLKRYGVRPHFEEASFVRNSMFEMFYAFTQFQLLWSRQFLTQFSFTFMPELYPGGVVAFPDHGIRCYIDSVTHTFDYTSGFVTQANLSAPAGYGENAPIDVSIGMIKPLTDREMQQLENQANAATD